MRLWGFIKRLCGRAGRTFAAAPLLDRQCEARQTILGQVKRISECAGIESANNELVNGNCIIIGVLASGKGRVMRLRYLIGHLRASSQSHNSLGRETNHHLQRHE